MPANFTYIMDNFMEWSMAGYVNVLGFFVWPIIFVAIIGYVHLKQESAAAAAVATIMLSAAFIGTNLFAGVEVLVQFLQIMVALAFTGLIIYWVARRRVR